jgi:membrane dipeptidase
MPLIVDAHEDLAWNILSFGRDYTRSAHETRRQENGTQIPAWNNGECLMGWPDYQQGQVAVIFGSLFATPLRFQSGAWDTVAYRTQEEAYRWYRKNLDEYYRLVDRHNDCFRLIRSQPDLQAVLQEWEKPLDGAQAASESDPAGPRAEHGEEQSPRAGHPVGLVMCIEGAECIRTMADVEEWWEAGVRFIGPAWGGNLYTGGTKEPGPLTREGHRLLETMQSVGFGLDISHMSPQSAEQALDIYEGTLYASHSNPLAVVKEDETCRHLTDRVIRGVVEHQGVIGIVPFNAFLRQGWTWELRHGKELVTLQDIVTHIDYICQLAGNAQHVGFGTDFDGGFGWHGVPQDIDTIADLQKISPLLIEKGYSETDVAAIFGGNMLRILRQTLPKR